MALRNIGLHYRDLQFQGLEKFNPAVQHIFLEGLGGENYFLVSFQKSRFQISLNAQLQPKMSTLQESKNRLAPITVKLGNYSQWNRSRDFNRAVKLPVDRGGFWVFGF